MGRVNPRNNPAMKRVIAPAPTVIVKPPPPVKTKRPTRSQPTINPTLIPNTQPRKYPDRNVTQPEKKPTDWCGCEFWDVGCKAGCLAKERITDPIESGTKWIGEGIEQQVTIPFTEGVEWWTQGATDAGESTQVFFDDAWTATADFFGTATEETIKTLDEVGEDLGDAVDSTGQAINVFLGNAGDAVDSTGKFIQDSIGGTAEWAGGMMAGVSSMAGNMMRGMGNMMRGIGNLGNFASQPTNWIKYILIGIAILIAGFLAWRMF